MVVIVDPHLKRVSSYPVYEKAQELGVLVQNRDKQEYEGWCWSGSSAWVDFFHPGSWDWWKSLFRLSDGKDKNAWRWKDSTDSVFIWNDMNEVGCFSLIYMRSNVTLFCPPAICLQWARNYNAQGQRTLRRLGAP